MRTSQDLKNDLISRMKNAMKNAAPEVPSESRYVIPGKHYRDERGRMVTVQRASSLRVSYTREGYSGVSEISRRKFDLKFTEVKS